MLTTAALQLLWDPASGRSHHGFQWWLGSHMRNLLWDEPQRLFYELCPIFAHSETSHRRRGRPCYHHMATTVAIFTLPGFAATYTTDLTAWNRQGNRHLRDRPFCYVYFLLLSLFHTRIYRAHFFRSYLTLSVIALLALISTWSSLWYSLFSYASYRLISIRDVIEEDLARLICTAILLCNSN